MCDVLRPVTINVRETMIVETSYAVRQVKIPVVVVAVRLPKTLPHWSDWTPPELNLVDDLTLLSWYLVPSGACVLRRFYSMGSCGCTEFLGIPKWNI